MIFVLKFSNIKQKGKYFARDNQINKIRESSESVKSSMWFINVTQSSYTRPKVNVFSLRHAFTNSSAHKYLVCLAKIISTNLFLLHSWVSLHFFILFMNFHDFFIYKVSTYKVRLW